MKYVHQRLRNDVGAAGYGLLAGIFTWIALVAIYYYGAIWLNDNGFFPEGKLSGYEQIPWAIIGLGMPLVILFLAYAVGNRVTNATENLDGWVDIVLKVVCGTILIGAIGAIIIVVAAVIAMIWLGCFVLGALTFYGALLGRNN